MRDKGWTMDQAKTAVAKAKDPWGQGWNLLSLDMKHAAVSRAVLSVVMSQLADEVRIEDIRNFMNMAMTHAGIVK